MCYWRRLSKRSVDNNDYEYTDERNSSAIGDYTNKTQPVISDSLSLFKALQVRHEPIEPARARQRAQQLQEIYAEDDEAQLICYRHAEVIVFLSTMAALLLLILSIAITCSLRIRKLTRAHRKSQFNHQRLGHHSMSPSLLSLSGNSAGSSSASSSSSSYIDNNKLNCWQSNSSQQLSPSSRIYTSATYNPEDRQRTNNGIYR